MHRIRGLVEFTSRYPAAWRVWRTHSVIGTAGSYRRFTRRSHWGPTPKPSRRSSTGTLGHCAVAQVCGRLPCFGRDFFMIKAIIAFAILFGGGGKFMLAIDDYSTLAVFAISLDNRDHLWGFRFAFFDHGRAVRIVTIV